VSAAPIKLRGAVVAVTGGGRGIGRAIAAEFAARGATVCIGDLDGEAAVDAAREIGGGAQPFQLDVADHDSFAAFLESVEEAAGPLDVLVNNAGIGVLGRFTEESHRESEKTIDVNLKGPLHGMKLALPGMIERGRGHVVNVASAAGKFRAPGLATYVASKHGVVGLTASVQDELRGTGVTATTVMPFVVRTELASGVKVPFERLTAEPEDVARAAVGSVSSRRREVFVPRWGHALDWLTRLAPKWLEARFRRSIGDDRAITGIDPAGRAAYTERLERQTGEAGGADDAGDAGDADDAGEAPAAERAPARE
jgi:short-subunit dehydrogenase